jgi:hypothetical protein
MNTSHRNPHSSLAGFGALFLAASVIAQGCSNDDNPEPVTPVVTGGTSSGGTSSNGKGGKGGDTSNAGSDAQAGGDAVGGTGNTGTGATGGTGTTGKGGKGGGHSSGGTGNTGNEGGSGNEGNEGGSGDEGGTGPVDCSPQGANQCYPCKPHDANNVEFLNQCNDSKCSKFDNAARIEGFADPLPPT